MKNTIKRMPVIGSVASWAWYVASVKRQHAAMASILAGQSQALESLSQELEVLHRDHITASERDTKEIGNLNSRLQTLNDRVSETKHALTLQSQPSVATPVPIQPRRRLADNHLLDTFYLAFENRFRGTPAEIYERLEVYSPLFTNLQTELKSKPILDIGCGRGEFLEFIKNLKLQPKGLDLNKEMVAKARSLGFDVTEEDALAFLLKQKTGSFAGITGFHFVEHIPFDELLIIFSECYRVLAPGGLLIFETPNPENLVIGSCNFYTDPSHLHPLPPHLLEFAVQFQGFTRTEIMRLRPQEFKDNSNRAISEILRRFYAAPDYAVIAHK